MKALQERKGELDGIVLIGWGHIPPCCSCRVKQSMTWLSLSLSLSLTLLLLLSIPPLWKIAQVRHTHPFTHKNNDNNAAVVINLRTIPEQNKPYLDPNWAIVHLIIDFCCVKILVLVMGHWNSRLFAFPINTSISKLAFSLFLSLSVLLFSQTWQHWLTHSLTHSLTAVT
jgi:hypothetical protein